MHRLLGLLLAALPALFPGVAGAQAYPAKPVRYLVAFGAGSGADTIARIVASGMTQTLGQQVIVDNRAGAAGNIAAEVAAKSPPDGYLLFQASQSHATNISLYKNLPYDVLRDFTFVTLLASSPSAVVVHPSVPAKTIKQLVALAKARPGVLNYASTGPGSATYLAGEMLKTHAGIDLHHVPYRGGGEAMTSVVTGEVSVYVAPLAAAFPFIEQGRVRALAVTTSKRLQALPGYPTVAESGYPGYEIGNWYGIVVPAKTPREIVATVHKAAVSALALPAVNKRLLDLGYVIVGNQPDEFAAFARAEVERLGKLIRTIGAKAE
jgi:tripartite-type tricarboxylate transporter receptor subunit TctC